MKLTHIIKSLAITATLSLSANVAHAEWTPSGPITIQIGFGTGGSTDILGRAIAAAMEANTGWDVIAENKPGGGGVAMFSSMVREKPDGLTVGMGVTIPTLMNLALRGDKLPFKADSFDYLATVVLAPVAIITRADAPYDTMAEYIAWTKENDGGIVSFDAKPQEMIMRAINKVEGINIELVSHNSGAESIQSILGGHTDAGFAAGAHIQYLKSGDIKMLAVATETRHAYAPDVTSLIEQGYHYSTEPYFYLAAPKGLDADTKAALAGALDDAITSEAVSGMIQNTMSTVPTNLGADGTFDKLNSGLSVVEALIEAQQ